MLSRTAILVIGVLFHLVYLRSIFDIYFKSPVVTVEDQFASIPNSPSGAVGESSAPAKRLFLIVGDGLRADKLFENPQLAPFLYDKALNVGRWGISHTRVPTESRPGHVAMIAGLYEDVSAVTTGWQLNPIHFDSVFNQSARTYSWGSPDILPMFREGASSKERINCSMYDPEAEDFTKESDKLDTWVFERVNELFVRASANETLSSELRAPRTVFFLHLLGLDMAGHFNRPYSPEYLNNLANVDRGIAELIRTLENAWGAEELTHTAFLFTADHGMSDWGSHGDGDPVNTRTPYIAWGAGIKAPIPHSEIEMSKSLLLHKTESEDLGWKVETKSRVDVAQADLAVMMSYLIGVNYPKNGVGSLPLELFNGSDKDLSIALYQNARQIHAQYASKANSRAKQLHFSKLVEFAFSIDFETVGNDLLKTQEWTNLNQISEDWISESLEGMRYLQRYDWLFLRAVITLGYLGWMLFALLFVLNSYVLPYSPEAQAKITDTKIETLMGPKVVPGSTPHANGTLPRLEPVTVNDDQNKIAKTAFVGLTATAFAYLLERTSPISYYAYTAFPLFFWFRVASDLPPLLRTLRKASTTTDGRSTREVLGTILLGVLIVQGVVVAYGQRRIISVLWPLASITPFFYTNVFANHKLLTAAWTILCFLMSVFTSLPTVQKEDIRFVASGGMIMVVVGIAYIVLRGGNYTLGGQIGLIAIATIVTKEASESLANKQGLPLGCQVLGWVVLASSLLLPLLHRLERTPGQAVSYQERLIILFLTFAPTFVILSISYEGLFYLAFWALLVVWIHLESAISESLGHDSLIITPGITSSSAAEQAGYRGLQFSDARIAIYFFFLIQAAFFGTGNIASVSSFSLDSVYRLIPVFSPFAMGILLLFKLLTPFAVISANLGILNRKLRVAPSALFMTVLTFCDVLTLNFFWMVRDEGSWLEIGSSISAFVIGGMLILFVISLEKVSDLMVGDVAL